MKNLFFLVALLAIGSCARQNLNYQSSHPNGNNQDNTAAPDQNNYTQAPQNNNQQNNYSTNNNGSYNNNVDYSSNSYQTFYDDLSPYGSWVNNPSYGYVWVPNAGQGFSPYCTNGQWVYTEYGWTWASNYSWGWAPFHYGRWFMDPMYGWMWVPGHEWGPAWVTWGQTNGYYGWAPIGPGVVVYEGYRPAAQYWTYVPQDHIMHANVSSYAINTYSVNYETTINYNNVNIINNHNTYNNAVYNSGPQPNEVEHVTGNKITAVQVNTTAKPIANTTNTNQLNLYRPTINKATANTTAPVKITPVNNLKPVNNTVAPSNPKGQPVIHNNQIQPVNNNNPRPIKPVKPVQQQPVQHEQPIQHQQPIQNEKPVQQQPVRTEPVQNNNPRPVQQNNNPHPQAPVQQNKPKQQPRPQQPKTVQDKKK